MPDLTREEVEAIIACAEHNSPALEANEIRRLGTLALRQMDEIERLLVEYRKVYDWGEALDADLAAARATIERVAAEVAGLKCEDCGGEGNVRDLSKSVYGDDDIFGDCASCDGTGRHPIADAIRAALRGEGAKSHVVDWCGVYRGTESDPREGGYCQTCKREVYDGEAGHSAALVSKEEGDG